MLSSHQCHHRIIHNFMTSSYMQWPIKINPVVLHKKKQWMIKCSCTFFCCCFFPLESILAHYRNAAVKSVCKKKKEEIYTVSRKTAPQSREVYILRRSGHLDVDVHVCVLLNLISNCTFLQWCMWTLTGFPHGIPGICEVV